jgi:hypothetical protein
LEYKVPNTICLSLKNPNILHHIFFPYEPHNSNKKPLQTVIL